MLFLCATWGAFIGHLGRRLAEEASSLLSRESPLLCRSVGWVGGGVGGGGSVFEQLDMWGIIIKVS